jgi:hypothetical protein
MTQDRADRTVKRWFWNFPNWGRLDGAIKDAAITLAQCGVEAQKEEWWPTADQHLKRAREYLAALIFAKGGFHCSQHIVQCC